MHSIEEQAGSYRIKRCAKAAGQMHDGPMQRCGADVTASLDLPPRLCRRIVSMMETATPFAASVQTQFQIIYQHGMDEPCGVVSLVSCAHGWKTEAQRIPPLEWPVLWIQQAQRSSTSLHASLRPLVLRSPSSFLPSPAVLAWFRACFHTDSALDKENVEPTVK